MPKSKRNKQIDLSKTKKHGLEGKKKLYEEVRSCVETYTHLFVFTVNDMRNSKIKSVREQWKHSRFFIGKNKVMAKALGMSEEDEFRMNLHKIGRRLKGERGLLFSNQAIEEVLKWFSSYSEGDFARSGNRATESVMLQEGPLSQFPHNLEPYLRQLGLPTALKKGIIHLVKDHTVCSVGDVLTPETAKIVKLLGYEMAEFYIKLECVWSQDGSFSEFSTQEEAKENINQENSSSVSVLTPSDVASMDVDEMEIAEPSDEMIENIIMKNRKSLMDNKLKQLEKESSSNESSGDEEMTDFAELKTDKKASLEKSNELSTDKVESDVSKLEDISETMEKESNDIISSSDSKTVSNDVQAEKISEVVEEAAITTNNAENANEDDISELVENTKVTTHDSKSGASEEKVSILVDNTKSITDNAEIVNKDEAISELVEDTNAASDKIDSESSEDEEIPQLVVDASDEVNGHLNTAKNMEKAIESISPNVDANKNSAKRVSLDKSALQSPIILEKRPKFSPKMTRSAMKAKKTVSKTAADKVEVNSQSKDEVNEEQPTRGRSHKRHSTGGSPAERTLRNRSIKIVKKKK